jgi:hypothetical protein
MVLSIKPPEKVAVSRLQQQEPPMVRGDVTPKTQDGRAGEVGRLHSTAGNMVLADAIYSR